MLLTGMNGKNWNSPIEVLVVDGVIFSVIPVYVSSMVVIDVISGVTSVVVVLLLL